jgi:hypothetical protein
MSAWDTGYFVQGHCALSVESYERVSSLTLLLAASYPYNAHRHLDLMIGGHQLDFLVDIPAFHLRTHYDAILNGSTVIERRKLRTEEKHAFAHSKCFRVTSSAPSLLA